MNEIWNNQAFWALLGTLFGGTVLAVVNKLLSRNKEKFDLASAIRNEIRKDNVDYRKEIDELNRRIESWQKKYYELEMELAKMKKILIQNGVDYPPR